MIQTKKAFLIAILFFLCLAPAQAQDTTALMKLTQSVTEQVIIPAYATLAQHSAQLSQTTATVCTDQQLSRAEKAKVSSNFHDTMQAWQAVQHFRFGPITTNDRHHRMQFWPDKKNLTARHLKKLLNSTESITPQELAQKSIAVQGLSAYERMLSDQRDQFCRLAPAIADNIAQMTAATHQEWQGFTKTFLNPSQENPDYRSVTETAREIQSSLAALVQFTLERKIRAVMGRAPEKSRFKRAESWRSAQSLTNIKSNLSAALLLYQSGTPSMQSFLKNYEEAASIDRIIVRALTNARSLLDNLGPSYHAALQRDDGYQTLQLIRDNLANAQTALDSDLRDVMGLGMGFNALDGD